MRAHVSLTIALAGLQMSGFYVLQSCRCVWILVRQSFVFIMQMPPSLSHSMMTMDWLFLTLISADFSCNVRLLQVFLRGVLTEMRSCSVRVKKLVIVGLSEGRCPTGLPFKRGDELIMNVIAKKILCQPASLELITVFICGVRTKDKSLMRTENSSLVNVWLEKFCIIFLLYWEVYVLMGLVVNLQNEDLHQFSGKRTFIDGGVYMSFSRSVGSRITSSVFMQFCIFLCAPNDFSCVRGF